jgi:simple sugar transport system ATP-binding protein
VLRGGQVTGVCDPREESNASLSRLMIGAEPPALNVRALKAGATVLEVSGLTLSGDPFDTDLHDIALSVRSGG